MKNKTLLFFSHKDTVLIFLILAITYGFFYSHGSYNQNTRMGLTFAIVERNSLTLNTSDIQNPDSNFYTGDYSVVNGQYYSDKAPGSSILAAIVYYPIRYFENIFHISQDVFAKMHLLTFLVIGLPSAFAGMLIYKFSKRLSKSKFKAFLVTIAIALGTICFPFSTTFFGHQLAGSLLFTSFYLIFATKEQSKDGHIRLLRLFLIGFLMGLAFQVEYLTAVIILPLIVYYFIVLWQNRQFKRVTNLIFPFLGGLLPIIVLMVYNKIVFGGVFKIGYQFLGDQHFQTEMSKGLMGITLPKISVLFYETFHPTYGIFWLSPVLIMIFVGAFYMLRDKQSRLELALSFVICFGYLVINSGYSTWWGGSSLGPRGVIPMLPFFCIPLIFVPKKWVPIMFVLAVVSVFQMTMAAATNFLVSAENISTISTDPFFSYSLLYNDCWVQLQNQRFSWIMGKYWFGIKDIRCLWPLFISQAFLTLILFINPKQPSLKGDSIN
jgi:4-amino-4-deoxy-L-arabinose transferase-like glycosyltransferase